MKKNLLLLTLLCLTMLCMGQKVPFQGKLIESGTAVEGTRTFVFDISAVGWTETHTDVAVTDGLYFVVLGSINPLPESLFNAADEQSLEIALYGPNSFQKINNGKISTHLTMVNIYLPPLKNTFLSIV